MSGLRDISLRTLLVAGAAGTLAAAVATGATPLDAHPRAGAAASTKRSLAARVALLERRARAASARANEALAAAGRPGRAGPAGPAGPAGFAGEQGAPGVDGAVGEHGAVSLGRPIPSGVTLTGAWGQRLAMPFGGSKPELTVSLPLAAPVALGDGDVGFPAGVAVTSDVLGDRCTGTFTAPAAAPGALCLYPATGAALLNVDAVEGLAYSSAPTLGAVVRITPAAAPVSPTNVLEVRGTWAYTAP